MHTVRPWGGLHKTLFITAMVGVVITMLVIREGCTGPSCLRVVNMLGLALLPLFYLAIRSGELERR